MRVVEDHQRSTQYVRDAVQQLLAQAIDLGMPRDVVDDVYRVTVLGAVGAQKRAAHLHIDVAPTSIRDAALRVGCSGRIPRVRREREHIANMRPYIRGTAK